MNLPARQRTWRSLPALLFLSLATATVSAQTFTTLYNFAKVGYNSLGTTNSDGATPYGGVILSGTTLYGTTDEGGISGRGTVFAVSTNGTGFTVLYTLRHSLVLFLELILTALVHMMV